MKHFMSNLCGYGNCKDWECYSCPNFKPRFCRIPVSRGLGERLYNLEERLWFKEYKKKHPNDDNKTYVF